MTPNYGSSQGFETWQQVEEKKRFYFKKNSNRVAKTMLLSLLLQFVLMFLFEFVYLFFRAFSEAMQYVAATGETSFQAIYQIVLNMMLNDPIFSTGLYYVPIAVIMFFSNMIPVWYCSKGSGIRLKGLFQGVRPTAGFVGLSIVFLFGLNFAGRIIYQLINAGLGLVGFRAPGSSLSFPTDSVLGAVFYVLFCCVIAPITEELMFRGVILRSLSRYNLFFACMVTSILFGIMHGNFAQMFPAFLMGLVLCYVTVKTGSVKLAIGLHILNNAVSVSLEALQSLFPENSGVYMAVNMAGGMLMIACFIATVILLIVLRKNIHFTSDDPLSAQRDNIITVPNLYQNFFSSAFIIVFIAIMAAMMLFGIFTSIA